MNLIKSIKQIGNKMKSDNVSAFAAEAALFIIMGFVPILLLLLTLVKYTPLTQDNILFLVKNFAPVAFQSSLEKIVEQIYENVNLSLILISIFSILWAAGKGFVSLIDGLNSVFEINERRNGFVIRLYAILYTLVFIVIIVICIIVYILGNQIFGLLSKYAPLVADVIDKFFQLRALISVFIFTVFFTFLYVAIPNRHTKIRRQIPGAIFSAVGWTGFSYFFSLYVNYSKNISLLYGSLATIVCVMLWLYTCMYIFLIGAEINMFGEQEHIQKKIQNKINEKKKHK